MIAKILMFVISASVCGGIFGGCASASFTTSPTTKIVSYDAPRVTGRISSADITESSGIAASKCQNGVFWTHNDSGDEAFIFAFNSAGDSLGTWRLPNAVNMDWEDIAAYKDDSGKCFIYIGEIGDNKLRRPVHAILRVAEPIVSAADSSSSRRDPLITSAAESLLFSYADLNQDAETLMVHPKTGVIYVVTKRVSGPAGVYQLQPHFGSATVQKAVHVAYVSVPAVPNGFLTGGDISPDGRRVVVCDYTQAYEYSLEEGQNDILKIWDQEPETVNLGKREAGEAVGYSADGNSLFATSEGKNSPIIEVRRQKQNPLR